MSHIGVRGHIPWVQDDLALVDQNQGYMTVCFEYLVLAPVKLRRTLAAFLYVPECFRRHRRLILSPRTSCQTAMLALSELSIESKTLGSGARALPLRVCLRTGVTDPSRDPLR